MDEGEHQQIRAKDVTWVVGKMDLSDKNVSETSENQTLPSWSAFNSLVTDEDVPLKIVGFCRFCHSLLQNMQPCTLP